VAGQECCAWTWDAGYGSAMRERPALFLGLLADQPELIAEVGVLRWRAAGSVGTPGPWIESTARDAGRDGLPFTLVAMDLEGRAIGAVTLGEVDDGCDAACVVRAPWVVRMVVRPGERMCGVGRLMMQAVEELALEQGHGQLWVTAADDFADFYRHCGWADAIDPEETSLSGSLVLSKELTHAM
jgi:GNAT superfamily N-acetyltransferase